MVECWECWQEMVMTNRHLRSVVLSRWHQVHNAEHNAAHKLIASLPTTDQPPTNHRPTTDQTLALPLSITLSTTYVTSLPDHHPTIPPSPACTGGSACSQNPTAASRVAGGRVAPTRGDPPVSAIRYAVTRSGSVWVGLGRPGSRGVTKGYSRPLSGHIAVRVRAFCTLLIFLDLFSPIHCSLAAHSLLICSWSVRVSLCTRPFACIRPSRVSLLTICSDLK